jgi:hypothetical protein
MTTLIVDGPRLINYQAEPQTVRINGDLPTVLEGVRLAKWTADQPTEIRRPLRVGDRVTLAYYDWDDSDRVPFATATVAKTQPVHRVVARKKVTDRWLITVKNVEAL